MQFLKRRLEQNTLLKEVDHRRDLNGKEALTLRLPSQVTAAAVSKAAEDAGFKVGKVDPVLHPQTRRDDFHVFPTMRRVSIFVSPGPRGGVKIVRNGERQPSVRDRQNIVKFFNALTQK